MAKLEILEFPDPRLRTVARPVKTFGPKLAKLAGDLIETMYAASGIGLASTQVNIHQRLLVLDVSETRDCPSVYVNPQILDAEGEETCEEGCLSVPGIYAEVARSAKIKVSYQDTQGETHIETIEGMHAICLQHEMDHLQGKLFVDYLSPLKQRMVRKKLEKQRRQEKKETAGVAL